MPLLFSSPQNRRTSFIRLSQKSQDFSLLKSPTESSIHGNREWDGRGGGIDDKTTRMVPLVPKVPSNVSPFEADRPPRGTIDGNDLLNASSSIDRIQEVLGAMPILLVDDSVSILKMTKRAIQNECANISFMEAKNGEEAFEWVVGAFKGFELIITDIQMPICNGFDFARRVRHFERENGLIPKLIIGISANDQQKIAEEAKESGMVLS